MTLEEFGQWVVDNSCKSRVSEDGIEYGELDFCCFDMEYSYNRTTGQVEILRVGEK